MKHLISSIFLLTIINSFQLHAIEKSQVHSFSSLSLANNLYGDLENKVLVSINNLNQLEEKKLNIKVDDSNSQQVAWAEVKVFRVMETPEEFATYFVKEGIPIELDIDGTEYDVEVIECSPNCKVTWYIK